MSELDEKDRNRILETLDSGGRMGYKSSFLIRELNLNLDSRSLGRELQKWSEVEARNPETQGPWNWVLKENSIGTPNQV